MDEVLWKLEPHTEAKHDILRRYLGAWYPIMGTYARNIGSDRLVYVDGFAGPGEYLGGEDGSPVIALKTLLQHALWSSKLRSLQYTFLFIEKIAEAADHLNTVLSRIPVPHNVSVHAEVGEFGTVIPELLNTLQRSGRRLAPAFVFVDAFGPTGFPMELLHRLLAYRESELLITLNLRSLDRLYLPVVERHPQIDLLYGTGDWRQCQGVAEPQSREDCLRNTYHTSLMKVPNVRVRDFRMINKHNQTSYYLVYATHHPKGLAVMKEAMSKVDPSGAFTYSDITNPNQPFLFGAEFDELHARNYAQELGSKNAGRAVGLEELRRATEEHEHYLRRHLTQALDILASENRAVPSSRKRGRGWPAGTTFRFP